MSLPVAILAGGRATRLGPIAERLPKALVDVAGRPFAVHQLELLRGHGLTDIVFLVGHLGEMICNTLGDGARWGVHVRYVFDGPRLLGTGGAIRRALPALGDTFFVMYGDSYLECDFGAIEEAFHWGREPALMTVFKNDDRFDRSNVLFDQGRIVRYDKVSRDPRMQHIDYGLGVLTDKALAPWARTQTAFDLAAVYQDLVARGQLAGFEVDQRFYEIGSPEGLEETRALLGARGDAS